MVAYGHGCLAFFDKNICRTAVKKPTLARLFSAAALVVYHFVASGEFSAQLQKPLTTADQIYSVPEVLCNSHPGGLGPQDHLIRFDDLEEIEMHINNIQL